MKTFFLIFLLVASFSCNLFASEPSLAQRENFKHIDALIALIEKARNAGMSDQEIKQLQLNLAGKDIDVLAYIEAFQDKKRKEHQKLKDFLSKRFLTVSDIFNEMVDMEPMKLEHLREELISAY